jgi:capsular polysaccharide transport system permease protein
MREFLRGFATQRRVLGGADHARDLHRLRPRQSRLCRLLGEFLIFALPVIVMWYFIRGKYEHGLLLVPFVWSGYLPILLFRHIGGHALRATRLNMALLYHRNVTRSTWSLRA